MITFSFNSLAVEKFAKILISRGNVKAIYKKRTNKVKKGKWLKEQTTIQTGDKSFVKLLLKDKSTLVVGPRSKTTLISSIKNKPSVINLIKGQVKSKISPNLLNKQEYKFFVKTPSAIVGVRGTEFLTSISPKTKSTSVITFSGEVSFASLGKLKDSLPDKLIQRLNSSDSVSVFAGEISVLSKNEAAPTSPKLVNPVQLNKIKLKSNKPLSKPKSNKTKSVIELNQISPNKLRGEEYAKSMSLPSVQEVSEEFDDFIPESQKSSDVLSSKNTSQSLTTQAKEASSMLEIVEIADEVSTLPVQNVIKMNVVVQ